MLYRATRRAACGRWACTPCAAMGRTAALALAAASCILLLTAWALPTAAFADEGSSASSQSSDSAQSPEPSGGAGETEDAGADTVRGIEGNLIDPTQRADNSFIYDTTIDTLLEQATLYEGNTVQVVGEAIGDLIQAGSFDGREMYWIMLTSTDAENKASISVLITAEQAKQIDHFGRYGVTGTILQVRGTFHQACSEHEGLPDIHSSNVEAITSGVEHADVLVLREFVPGFIAVLLGVILMGAYYFARERSR